MIPLDDVADAAVVDAAESADSGASDAMPSFEYAARFGASGADESYGVSTDSLGNAFVVGRFEGTVDFGTGPLTSAGSSDAFLVKIAPSGTTVWAKRFGDTSDDQGSAVGTTADGSVYASGYVEGTVDFGTGPITTAGGVFLAKYTAGGVPVWARVFAGAVGPAEVAADASGDAILLVEFNGSLNFGGGAHVAANRDIAVAKFKASDGAFVWSKTFGGANLDNANGLAIDSSGDVFVAGKSDSQVTIGASTLDPIGLDDALVFRLAGATGTPIWARRMGGSGYSSASDIAIGSDNRLLVSGSFTGTIDLGGGAIPATGGYDAFLTAILAVDGSVVWSAAFGGAGAEFADSVAVFADGHAAVEGTFDTTLDVGAGVLTTAGLADVFLIEVDEQGNTVAAARYGGSQGEFAKGVVTTSSDVVFVGSFRGAVDFGSAVLTAAGSLDAFVVRRSR